LRFDKFYLLSFNRKKIVKPLYCTVLHKVAVCCITITGDINYTGTGKLITRQAAGIYIAI